MTKKKAKKKASKRRVAKKKKLRLFKVTDIYDFVQQLEEIEEECGVHSFLGPEMREEGMCAIRKLTEAADAKFRENVNDYVVAPQIHVDYMFGSQMTFYYIYLPGSKGKDEYNRTQRTPLKFINQLGGWALASDTEGTVFLDVDVAMDFCEMLNHARGVRKLKRGGPISQQC